MTDYVPIAPESPAPSVYGGADLTDYVPIAPESQHRPFTAERFDGLWSNLHLPNQHDVNVLGTIDVDAQTSQVIV